MTYRLLLFAYLLLAALLLGLLLLGLRSPAALSLDVGTAGDEPVLLNFHQPERNADTAFRWSGPGSRLRLPAAQASPHTLALRLNGDALHALEAPTLRLEHADQTVAALDLAPGWRVYHVLLPAGVAASREPLALVSALARPGPTDSRYLGVPLDWLRLTPLGRPSPLDWALLLAAVGYGGYRLWRSKQASGAPPSDPSSLTPHPSPLIPHPSSLIPHPFPLAFGLAHLLLVLPLPAEWRSLGALVLLLLPGVLLALLLFRHEADPLLLTFLGLCGGLALWALLLLGLQALPGPLPGWLVLLACDGLSVIGYGLWVRGQGLEGRGQGAGALTAHRSPAVYALLLVLLLGAAVRLPLLGSSEFQGDESRAILMAASVRDGQDEVLLLRPKGPVEVLLPAGLLALTGQMTEGAARLPFALAGVGMLLGVFLLARQMLNDEGARLPLSGAAVGLLAAALLALDGFMVAFARIVQYQSVILVLMTGALWCGWRFAYGVPHPRRYLLSAAVLAAVAMLAHYDGALVLPALGWLALWGGWRRGWRGAAWVRGLAPPLLAGAGLLLAFYLPFVLNEHFSAATADYLAYRLREGDTTSLSFNNLVGYYELASFYSPAFQVAALALVLLGGLLAWLVHYGRAAGWALAGLLLLGSVLLLLRPAALVLPGGQNWALLAFGLPLAGLALLPSLPAALRVLLLWFAAPFVAMAFLIAEPRTHFYAMHPAAALLISLALLGLAHWLARRRLVWAWRALVGVGVLLALLALPYLYIAFVRPQPEFLRDFPASRPALYVASYGDSLPTDAGYFAFPQRDGWKVAGELFRREVLRGDYGSNKKPLITNWYMRGVYRCSATPDYFLLARSESYLLPEGYDLFGVILVDDRRMMDIYSRAPVSAQVPRVFELADYRAAFDARQVQSFPTQRFLFDVVPQYHLRATWPGGLTLRGYDLFGPPLEPGDTLIVSLYWQAAQPLAAGAAPVLELTNEQGEPLGRAVPHCGDGTAAAWRAGAGRISDIAFRLPLPADLPPGTYRLRLGIRAEPGGAWLPLADGTPRLELGTLQVHPAAE
jgi:hypothetical protein